jgi:hypothetical protein
MEEQRRKRWPLANKTEKERLIQNNRFAFKINNSFSNPGGAGYFSKRNTLVLDDVTGT